MFGSRKIERRLHEDLAFRMLAAGSFPRHRTICAFRLKALSALFVQVVRLAREMGRVKLGTVAIDGTKVKANASRHKAMSYERMKQAEVDAEQYRHTEAMAARLRTEEGRAAYRKRKREWITEPPNGWIKNVLGFRQFSLRGLHRVRAEWELVCMALNLGRTAVLGTR